MQPKPNKGERKKKKAVKWNKKCASNLQYSSATLIQPPVRVTKQFLIMGSWAVFFHGTPALAARTGRAELSEGDGGGQVCMWDLCPVRHGAGSEESCGKPGRVKSWLRRRASCCAAAAGFVLVWGLLPFPHNRCLDFLGPSPRAGLQPLGVLLLQMVSREVAQQTCNMLLTAICFLKSELWADLGLDAQSSFMPPLFSYKMEALGT